MATGGSPAGLGESFPQGRLAHGMWRLHDLCYPSWQLGGDMAKSKPVYGRGTGKPHPIDVRVGARVRQRRTLLGEHFFEDMSPAVADSSPAARKSGKAKEPPNFETDPMVKRETLELVRAYYKIEDAVVRHRLYYSTKALGAAGA